MQSLAPFLPAVARLATKRTDTTTFFVETSAGLFGIKASYDGGSLPPAFAAVKSFNVGFVVGTKDRQ